MGPVQLSKRGRIALCEVDSPPVNALSQAVRQGLADCMKAALEDPEVDAVVLACKGRTFIAGADIREFGAPPQPPQLPEVLLMIEDSDKPVVAAIHGTAFGGGLEVALACHYRLAVASAKCGLPEVKLGIIPGAGGTQRLPRLIGAAAALEAIATGEPIAAPRAKELGLLDAIATGDLVDEAIGFAQAVAGKPVRRTRLLTEQVERARAELGIFDEYAKKTAKAKRGFEAPQRAIEAVRDAVTLPFEEGVKREREAYLALRFSDQSKALRHVFFAEREVARIPDVAADTPLIPIAKVGIIGAGTMGAGIAIACAGAGLEVLLMDRERQYVDKGLASITASYQSSVQRGRMTEAQMLERVGRVKGVTSYAELADVDLVIEAVFEEMEIKKQVFTELDRVCKRGAILATNTSTLDVNEIAAVTSRPEQVIGLHFFSPANAMRLLEIVRGSATSKSVVATSMRLAKTLDKIGVLVGVCPGFVGNRILYAYRREAFFLLEEGALPQQIDKALTDFGFAMGPFAVSDLAGLDISWRVRKAQGKPRGQRYSGTVADRLCELGHFGQKTGQGFYRYAAGSRTPQPYPELTAWVELTSKELGIERRSVSDEEVVQRCIYAMINEGCQILEEGIALRASDIDVIWLNGYGFPAFRGGPMCYGELVGLSTVYETMARFRERHGNVWEPSPLLARLAKSGGSFANAAASAR
jgi:3-hydroxyacyl-CoA dehydrogenase